MALENSAAPPGGELTLSHNALIAAYHSDWILFKVILCIIMLFLANQLFSTGRFSLKI